MGQLGQFIEGGGIDPSTVEPGKDFTPLPPGWYPFEVEAVEIKPTAAKGGQLLKVTLGVIGEQYNGRKVFLNINILNKSAKATEIGRRELADLARACGIAYLDDEDKLLGKQLECKLAVKQDKGYEPDNMVKGYRPLGAAPIAAPTAAPAAAAAPAVGTAPTPQPAAAKCACKMPWELK